MKKTICTILILFAIIAAIFANPAIAVIDFDSGNWCTAEEAIVMTDAFRNELVRSGKANVITRNRLDALKNEIRFQMSDWADPSRIKQAGNMVGADYMIFGRFGTMGGNGYLQVEMIDVETARIFHSSRLVLTSWREFDRRVNALVQEFTGKLPAQPIFTGAWSTQLSHNNIIDTYIITFSGADRLSVTIRSLMNEREITETAQGTYTYNENILKITVFLRDSKIPHIADIQWSSVVSVNESNNSFNMLIKPTSAGTNQVRATFTRE